MQMRFVKVVCILLVYFGFFSMSWLGLLIVLIYGMIVLYILVLISIWLGFFNQFNCILEWREGDSVIKLFCILQLNYYYI